MGSFSSRKLTLFLLILAGFVFSEGMLWAQNQAIRPDVPTRKIEDDSALRVSLEASWFRDPPSKTLVKKPEIHSLAGGGQIQVRTESSGQNRDEFAVVLARARNGAYPGWAQGSWVLTRRRDTGEGSRIRVFLRSDFNTYVQFRPFTNEKSCMDVVLYDAYVIRSLPLPVPFERLYTMPVEDALALAGNQFPRRYFDPDPGVYRDSRTFTSSVRARLPELDYAEDGAVDENGNYVFINTLGNQDFLTRGLNCSGFAKWIVDGILRPISGGRLPIAPLKTPFGARGSSLTDTWEEERDPYFGLDWCRNLAAAAISEQRSAAFGALEEIEVRNWPFSQVIIRRPGSSSVYAYPGFLQNAGFGVEGLYPLLYTLAIDEPGRIYLAAVNNEIGAPITPDNPRGLPRFRQYYHIAVFVPYFTEQGNFDVAVFESAEETSISRFRSRYPGQFVNLVRVPIEGKFDP